MALTISSNTNWSALEDTSSSTVTTIQGGTKTFTVTAGKAWSAGMPLAATAVGAKLYTCLYTNSVTSYSGTTLTFTANGYTTPYTTVGVLCTMYGDFAKQAFASNSITIGTGVKVFNTRPNLTLVNGDPVIACNRSAPQNNMVSTVLSYDTTTGVMVLSSASINGSGTVADWQFVSGGSFSSWLIHPIHSETVNVNNGVTLNLDATNVGMPTNVSANGTGIISMTNNSTTTPIVYKLSQRASATSVGRITVLQNAIFQTRGNFINIGTGNGGALTVNLPSIWDGLTFPTYVEVETGNNTNVYERWGIMPSLYYGMYRYGYLQGADIGITPSNVLIANYGGGTGVGTLGTITGGTGYGGVISTLGTITGGTGGTSGTYSNVPLTVSSGTVGNGATATITVYGGAVVNIIITNPGSGYSATTVLSAASGNIGNTTGFSVPVTAVLSSWTFTNVPLTGGTGTGATANITIASGIVTAVVPTNAGSGYTTGDVLSASTTYLGAGSSFSVPISLIGSITGSFPVTGGSGSGGIICIGSVATASIGRLGTITGGSGYVNGTYNNVPIRANSGTGAAARVNATVSGGAVTALTLVDGGTGYGAGIVFTIENTYLGGSGSGFSCTVSSLANYVNGASFVGYGSSPSPYAVGDILTAQTGGSIQPQFYVAEVGDFSCTTPATNIVTAKVYTAPTSASYISSYKPITTVTGGSGTGAVFVSYYSPANGFNVGAQVGFFVAGTGYKVGDLLTVNPGGMVLQVTEVSDSITPNFTQKVCTYDPAGRNLRFGADPNAMAVPNGARIRMPNIVIDSLATEAPLIVPVSAATPTFVFESTAAINDFTNNGNQLYVDYEGLGSTTKTANTYTTLARNQRGTYQNSHLAGAIVTQTCAGRAAGTTQKAQFNTNSGGAVDCDTTMFGGWFTPQAYIGRLHNLVRCGWMGGLNISTTTGPCNISYFSQAGNPWTLADQQCNLVYVQNKITVNNGTMIQSNLNGTSASVPFVQLNGCPSITGLNNLNLITVRETRGDTRAVYIFNSSFVDDSTSIPYNLNMCGCLYIENTVANHRAHDMVFAERPCRTINCNSGTVVGGSYNTAAASFTPVQLTNCTGIILHNISFVPGLCPPGGNIITTDGGCSNIIIHDVTGNGAFAGYNRINLFGSTGGLGTIMANFAVSNLKNGLSPTSNNVQSNVTTQNCRTSYNLSNSYDLTNADFTLSAYNVTKTTGTGMGHAAIDYCDFVSSVVPYWATAGSGTPNLPDASWFYNLADISTTTQNLTSISTGRIIIGCGGLNNLYTQYTINGSVNTYPDNGGRFYLGGANDSVRFVNRLPLRGIVGFRSVDPVSNISVASPTFGQGWYKFTLTNNGSGYSATGGGGNANFQLTGGSGYGGNFVQTAQSGAVITGGYITSGIGYKAGDVLSVVQYPGVSWPGSGAQITLSNGITEQFRMCPWGQDITSVAYQNLSYSNLQTAFSAMSGYNSNVGLQFDFLITADSNARDVNAYFNYYSLATNIDPTFSPPVGYVHLNLTNLQNGSRVAAYSGSTYQDGGTSTTTDTLNLPYNFDGTTQNSNIKIRLYGYTTSDYTQSYNRSDVTKAISQSLDAWISVYNPSTVASYTLLDTTAKCYDAEKYWISRPAQDLKSDYSSRSSTGNNYGSYNLIIDPTASNNFSETGGTITMRSSAINTSNNMSITTTGTITLQNGATTGTSPLFASNGKSGVITLNVPTGASVAVYNTIGTRVYFVASSTGTDQIVIPFGVLTGSYTYKVSKYGYTSSIGSVSISTGGFLSATVTLLPDSNISQNTVSVVSSYAILASLDKIYDYAAYYETTSSGINYNRLATRSGSSLDFGSSVISFSATSPTPWVYNPTTLIIGTSSSLSTGGYFTEFATTSTVSWNNVSHSLVYTDNIGRHVQITAPSIISGSRVQIYNLTNSVEIDNSIVVGNNGYILNTLYTTDKLYRIRATWQSGISAKDEFQSTGTFGSYGLVFNGSQSDCYAYNANAVDGSTVTEFIADYPNVYIDISDPDGITSLSRLYAWYHYTLTTVSGIDKFFMAITAPDTANYIIDQSISNILLDNISNIPVRVIGGYLSRKDGTTVIALTSGSIQMDPGKAYVATGSGGSGPTTSEIVSAMDSSSTKLAKLDANISSRATPTDCLIASQL